MRSRLSALVMLTGLLAAPAFADDAAPKHKETQSDSFIMIEPMYTTVVDAGRPWIFPIRFCARRPIWGCRCCAMPMSAA